MIKDYFGEWSSGTLGRGRFAALYLGIVVIAFIVMFALFNGVFASTEGATGPRNLINNLPPITSGLLTILMLALQIAALNIVGKRGRDIGVSGLLTIAAFIVVMFGSFAIMGQGGGILTLGFIALLALLPTGQLKRAPAA